METRPAQAAATPRLGRYDIDPAGSAVRFRTRHLSGLAPVRGRLQIRAGTVDVAEPASASRVIVEIDTAGLRSGNPAREEFGVTASPGLAARYLDVSLEVRCVARS